MTSPAERQSSAAALRSAYRTMERLQKRLDARERAAHEPIAVVGIGCRFPGGAVNPDSYWSLLSGGVDAVGAIPPERWDAESFFSATPTPGKLGTKSGGFLDRVDEFDHEFFGISRREAQVMDPQQRITLEVAWEALENAGLAPAEQAGSRTGVFMGVCSSDFALEHLRGPSDFSAHASTGSAHSVLTGRLSYTLDLRGPSLAVDTACSSSLVAVQLACQSLRAGECDTALGGGVNVVLSPLPSISFSQFGRMVSVDGRCKAFDASANGYVRSEGCGIVVLRRLSDAIGDGDRVLAVIRGGAVNQDGRSAGVTAPNGAAQAHVLRQAVAAARIPPASVSLIEAHGTGTRLGDPIEVEALAEVYGRPDGPPVYLGSSKTNIGHPEAAAGIAGLIKVVLALHHEAIPPNVHFQRLNPDISFAGTTFKVPTELTRWPDNGDRRAAAISAFGFSGTNAHLIVESAPESPAAEPDERRPQSVLALSARTPEALTELAERYRDRLAADTPERLADLCHSANTGRSLFRHRLAVTGRSRQEVADRLAAFAEGAEDAEGTASGEARAGETVFVFTGQGVQRVGMACGLYATHPAFRAALERCEQILRPMLERPLLSVLYPADQDSPDAERINETGYAQPAVFAVGYALAELWRSWGVEPAAVVGHSLGEYVASCVAGVMTLEEALRLTVARSRLMEQLSGSGAMAAISAPELVVAEEIADHPDRISIAAVNGPASTTVSGARELVDAVCEVFTARGIRAKRLHITTSSHSPLVEPILDELRRAASDIAFQPPRVPLVSNLDGTLWDWDRAPDADYWCRHARQPVRFASSVATLLGLGYRNFVEVGPSPVLLGLIDDIVPPEQDVALLPSLRAQQDDWHVITDSVARLHARGVAVDWSGWDRDYARSRVPLPTYPFEKTVCGPEPRQRGTGLHDEWDTPEGPGGVAGSDTDQYPDEDLLHRLDWESADLPTEEAGEAPAGGRVWLLLADSTGMAEECAASLAERAARCVLAIRGDTYHYDGSGRATVRPSHRQDLVDLLAAVVEPGEEVEVVHLWSLDADLDRSASAEQLLRAQQDACMSAVRAVQALVSTSAEHTARLWLVTRGAVRPTDAGEAPLALSAAPLWGLGRAFQQEHTACWGGLIDLGPRDAAADLAPRLLRETTRPDGEDQVALHGTARYVARLVRDRQPARAARGVRWRRDAAYLITGGLSGVGLAVARSLARAGARHLVLVGRTPIPPRREWAELPADHPAAARTAAVRELEALGTSVYPASFDVAEEKQLEAFLHGYDSEGRPPIRGVVHAAGVGDMVPLAELEPDVLDWHLRGKAGGAWTLHRGLADRPLDFFVLCSSTSSLLSSPYYGAYAAANAFLDALAEQRRGDGLPGLSISWGIWRDTGMATGAAEATPGLSRGMGTLAPTQALRVLHRLLRTEAAHLAVVPVDWADWGSRYRQVSGSRMLCRLVDDGPADGPATRRSESRRKLFISRGELMGLPEKQRLETLSERLLLSVTAALETRADRLDPDRPLLDLGVDSLMAVELKNAVESGLGVSLPVVAFLDGAHVRDLAGLILSRLTDADGGGPGPAIERVARYEDVAEELLAELAGTPAGRAGTSSEDPS